MKFTTGAIKGLWHIDLEPVEDHRGYFARAWCRDEFLDHGLDAEWEQANLQVSPHQGTLRGIHYQLPPHGEVKLVRCTQGAVFDVAIDLRPDSPTYRRWNGVELTARNRRSVWVPTGCAHGYVTLEDDSEVTYLTSRAYAPESVRAVRFDDPAFAIEWPVAVSTLPGAHDSWEWYSDEAAEEYRSALAQLSGGSRA